MSGTVRQLGNGNTAAGNLALDNFSTSSSGKDNTAFGHEALQNLSPTQNESTAFGSQALTESAIGENSAFGAYAGANITHSRNAVFGNWASRWTNGHDNAAFGWRAMAGDENTGNAPSDLPTGRYNAAFGTDSMRYRPDGNHNTAFGYRSMYMINGDDADHNTGVGSESLMNVTGPHNSALGRKAGHTITSGDHNTFLGSGADSTNDNGKYRTAVGADVKVARDNSVILGRQEDRVGIRTNIPLAALHIISGTVPTSMNDNLIVTNATGSGSAIAASTTGTGHSIVSSTTGKGHAIYSSAVGTSDDSGVALRTIGGHKYKTVVFKPYDETPGDTDVYNATINDHVIIVSYADIPLTAAAGTISLPEPSMINDGSVFIIRNASPNPVTIKTQLGTAVFRQLGSSDNLPFTSPDILATPISAIYISTGSRYYRIG